MGIIKKCPQCGSEFEGRSNKMYCSDKCKMVAFKENQVTEIVMEDKDKDISKTDNVGFSITRKMEKEPLRERSEDRELEIELRKLELEHIWTLAKIQSEENEKERNFELQKMQLDFEQERQILVNEIFKLEQAQEAFHSIPQKEPTPTENKRILPKPLKKEYDKIVKGYFEREHQPINLSQIEVYKKEVIELGRKVVLHAKDNDIPKKDLVAFIQLKKMLNGYDKMIEVIGKLSFLAAKVTGYKLSDNLREELEESLG